MNIREIKIIRMNDGDGGAHDTYFMIKGSDFDKAKQLCEEAEKQFYEEYSSISLYEMILKSFNDNNIEYSMFAFCDVDYEF